MSVYAGKTGIDYFLPLTGKNPVYAGILPSLIWIIKIHPDKAIIYHDICSFVGNVKGMDIRKVKNTILEWNLEQNILQT